MKLSDTCFFLWRLSFGQLFYCSYRYESFFVTNGIRKNAWKLQRTYVTVLDQRSFQCFLHLPLPHDRNSGIENCCLRPTTHEKNPFSILHVQGSGREGKVPWGGGGGEEDRRPLDSHPKNVYYGDVFGFRAVYVCGSRLSPGGRGEKPTATLNSQIKKELSFLPLSSPYPLESQRREFKIHSRSRFF